MAKLSAYGRTMVEEWVKESTISETMHIVRVMSDGKRLGKMKYKTHSSGWTHVGVGHDLAHMGYKRTK